MARLMLIAARSFAENFWSIFIVPLSRSIRAYFELWLEIKRAKNTWKELHSSKTEVLCALENVKDKKGKEADDFL